MNTTTDYSYNIGPTQYKQSVGGQPRPTKFSDLKFHHTTIDFNKTQTAGTVQNSGNGLALGGGGGPMQHPQNGVQMLGKNQKYAVPGNTGGIHNTGGKKTNHSIDLG